MRSNLVPRDVGEGYYTLAGKVLSYFPKIYINYVLITAVNINLIKFKLEAVLLDVFTSTPLGRKKALSLQPGV